MKPVVLWGATGQARVLREALSHLGYAPAALFDNRAVPSPFPDTPLFIGEHGFAEWMRTADAVGMACCVAIGGARGAERVRMQHWLAAYGLAPLTVVHPRAFVAADVTLGLGSQILAMTAVSTGCRLGEATIVNTAASVDHDCDIGAGVHIGPGARLAGEISVGDSSFIGTGATVLPRIRIGLGAIVGAGAVVTRDVPDHTVVLGVPARIARPVK
ncbi:acetyltransferase [Luteibacter sp.]|uniref:acetyltransferase n=1 Tax=Luteibacter sp. TaxID=1886636 RepID=UPI003F7DA410